ncbi:MAG: phage Gp37/Gp68 family protein [Minwuia sp.]|nr:phage Gp37/Gp68 family protein [Minwuia sp.]
MTSISWTGETWNPIVGCSIVSPGCTNCYAMRMAHRLGAMPKVPHYHGLTRKVNGNPVWTGRIAAAPDRTWQEPLRRRKPTTYFVNSMGDLFHDQVPTKQIDQVFAIMAASPQHTFQILTKRPDRMRAYMADAEARIQGRLRCVDRFIATGGEHGRGFDAWPLPNVWLGVSVENQAAADSRIPPLLATPAAIRFISAEPLLGPVDLTALQHDGLFEVNAMSGTNGVYRPHGGLCARLDWVICGGESGPGARPMHPDWARSLRDQCAAADVPFHFKQWGAWRPTDRWHPGYIQSMTAIDPEGGAVPIDVNPDDIGGQRFLFSNKKDTGRLLDGVEHDAMPPHAGGA